MEHTFECFLDNFSDTVDLLNTDDAQTFYVGELRRGLRNATLTKERDICKGKVCGSC